MTKRDDQWRPSEMPALLIAHVGRLVTRASDESLRPVGISASQLPVLAALKNGERRTQTDLARIASVEQPSMAQLLARMERGGLVRREPSPDDRRSSLISLTDLAFARLEPARDVLRGVDEDACAGFSDEELTLLLALVTRLARNVEREG